MTRRSVEALDTDIVTLLIQFLKTGKYIMIYLNMYYISAYVRSYQQIHDYHATFIYGYDCHSGIFMIADFFDGKYSYRTATFEELSSAYQSMDRFAQQEETSGVSLLSLNESPFNYYANIKWRFNTGLVYAQINDYLASKDSYAILGLPNENLTCGINVYNQIIANLRDLLKGRRILAEFHAKPFHISWNHKTVMLERIRYMGEAGCLENHEQIYGEYRNVVQLAYVVRSTALKSFVTNNAGPMERVIDKMMEMVREETRILQYMIHRIKLET